MKRISRETAGNFCQEMEWFCVSICHMPHSRITLVKFLIYNSPSHIGGNEENTFSPTHIANVAPRSWYPALHTYCTSSPTLYESSSGVIDPYFNDPGFLQVTAEIKTKEIFYNMVFLKKYTVILPMHVGMGKENSPVSVHVVNAEPCNLYPRSQENETCSLIM